MITFWNGAAAKEYFVSQILQEPARQGTPLTELERDMLYFTETAPDARPEFVEKAAEFDSQHSQEDYEAKVRSLLRDVWEHAVPEVRDNLREAYAILKTEDHYILVMLEDALGGKLKKKSAGIF